MGELPSTKRQCAIKFRQTIIEELAGVTLNP